MGEGGLIHRIALFPGELWSFQVIWGLDVEVASPAFLVELWPVLAQPTHRVGASRWPLPQAVSSDSRMKVALSWDCGVETVYRGNPVCLNLLLATH